MSDQHATKEVDQLAIIRGLLERQAAKTDALEAKVDASRAEGSNRGSAQEAFNRRIEANVREIGNEVKNLGHRVNYVEQGLGEAREQIRELRDQDATITRETSETDLEHAAALGGAIAHVRTLDESIADINEKLDVQARELAAQSRVNMAVCEVMGVDYAAVSAPTPPQESSIEAKDRAEKQRPRVDLVKVSRENTSALILAALTFLTMLAKIAHDLLQQAPSPH